VEDLRIEHGATDVPATGLVELLDPLPDAATIAEALAASFGAEFEIEVTPVDLSPAERATAMKARVKYRDDAWTWRR